MIKSSRVRLTATLAVSGMVICCSTFFLYRSGNVAVNLKSEKKIAPSPYRAAKRATQPRQSRTRRVSRIDPWTTVPTSEYIECRLVAEDIYVRNTIFGVSSEIQIECIPFGSKLGGHRSYLIENLPLSFLRKYYDEITEGDLSVGISNVFVFKHNDTLVVEKDAEIMIKELRSLQVSWPMNPNYIFRRRILAFVISTSDVQNRYSSSVLFPYLFGNDQVSMKSQFEACSGGKLRMEPILGGVADVTLSKTMMQYSPREAAFEAMEIFENKYGIDNLESFVDSILFCLPPGMASFAASATTNHYRSIYNDKNCVRLSVLMHEIGHNIGLGHASKNGNPYADITGYMGRSERQIGAPQKCFNAAQHWQLGWYADHSMDWKVDFSPPRILKLASFVDYKFLRDKSAVVIINLADKLFLQLNSAKSFNVGTGDYQNMVTITEKENSNVVDGLDAVFHSRFELGGFDAAGNTLVIEMCDFIKEGDGDIDVAVLSIGVESSVCESYHSQFDPPTDVPTTRAPTHAPTRAPTSGHRNDYSSFQKHISRTKSSVRGTYGSDSFHSSSLQSNSDFHGL